MPNQFCADIEFQLKCMVYIFTFQIVNAMFIRQEFEGKYLIQIEFNNLNRFLKKKLSSYQWFRIPCKKNFVFLCVSKDQLNKDIIFKESFFSLCYI